MIYAVLMYVCTYCVLRRYIGIVCSTYKERFRELNEYCSVPVFVFFTGCTLKAEVSRSKLSRSSQSSRQQPAYKSEKRGLCFRGELSIIRAL